MDQNLREAVDAPAEPHQGARGEKGIGKTFYETTKQTRKEGERIMIATETALENLTLNIQQEIRVNASLETTFQALLGHSAGDQTSDAAGIQRSAVHVVPGRQQRAVPLE